MLSRNKSVLIIGIGRFGSYLACKFAELGNEVMVVDLAEDKINNLISIVTSAQIGDCTKEEVIQTLGVSNFDICFVCIGSNFQAAIEITTLLKEYGANYIVAKANTDLHEKILIRNGVDEIVYPQKESANKTAMRMSYYNILDYIELTNEYSILEIHPLESWIDKTIGQVDVREHYGLNIIATKVADKVFPLPGAKHVFKKNEQLIVIANKGDFINLLKKQ